MVERAAVAEKAAENGRNIKEPYMLGNGRDKK